MPQRGPYSPEVAHARARIAGLQRWGKRPDDDPELIEARQKLAEAKGDNPITKRDKAIDRIVADWPELSNEQVARIVGLLRTPNKGHGDE